MKTLYLLKMLFSTLKIVSLMQKTKKRMKCYFIVQNLHLYIKKLSIIL